MVRFSCLFLPLLLIGEGVASAQRFTPGEILVLFSPGSPGKTAVDRALAHSPPELAALDPVVTPLEAGAGIPLKAVRISSGNWVLMSVDSRRLTNRVALQLRARAHVEAVAITTLEKMPAVQVQFSPGSTESEILSGAISGGSAEPLAGLVQQIGTALELPLNGEARENTQLYLKIDYLALTPIVVERLKTLPGIESVQLNYKVGFRSVP
jgi:hypothetical protein